MRETYEPQTPKPKPEAPITTAERARGRAYLVLTSAIEWVVIAVLLAAILFVAFGTDAADSLAEWLAESR